jgi:hypothetical protein
MSIREKYDEFVKKYGHEPHYAYCTIQWKDDGETQDDLIKLSCDVGDDDDLIFYYADGIGDLESLTQSGPGEDFIVLEETVSFE